MPTGGRLGVAMVGAGFIGDYHLAGLGYRTGPRARADHPQPGQGRVPGAPLRSPEMTARNFGAALARPDVDALVIATPDDTHEALALAAAQAGKAILLQKRWRPRQPPAAASSRRRGRRVSTCR